MYERENILRIFKETKRAMQEGNSAKIKILSDQTTNSAALAQDPDNIAAAVIIYSLSKVIEREDYKKLSGWNNFYNVYTKTVDKIISSIEKKDDKSYKDSIEAIRKAIEGLSGKLGGYIKDVFQKANINKASRLYEHGISMEKTAKLLGITLFELASYAGEKELSDVPEAKTVDIKTRIKTAMEMFE